MGTREASKVADGFSSRSSYEVEKRPDHLPFEGSPAAPFKLVVARGPLAASGYFGFSPQPYCLCL
jgi:hypothetical protein